MILHCKLFVNKLFVSIFVDKFFFLIYNDHMENVATNQFQEIAMEIRSKIPQAVANKGISILDFEAEMIRRNISGITVKRILEGRSNLSMRVIEAVAEVLEIKSMDEIFEIV